MILPEKRRGRKKAEIPLTPMIDIVFLLLIYFLLTTNFLVEEGITINLPEANAVDPRIQTEITVCLDRNGNVIFKEREMSFELLFTTLKEMIDPHGDQLVVVKADKEVALKAAVRVMDIAKTAGAARLSLATERKY